MENVCISNSQKKLLLVRRWILYGFDPMVNHHHHHLGDSFLEPFSRHGNLQAKSK